MKNYKMKLLITLLSLMMIFILIPDNVHATDDTSAENYAAEVTVDGTSAKYSTFNEAMQAALNSKSAATITLLQDGEVKPGSYSTDSYQITSGKNITIDLNGKTLSTNYGLENPIQVKNGGSLTITGTESGSTFKIDGSSSASDVNSLILVENGGSLALNGGTYSGGVHYSTQDPTGSLISVRPTADTTGSESASTVTIQNITAETNGHVLYVRDASYSYTKPVRASVTVSGSYFTSTSGHALYASAYKENESVSLSVSNSYFNFDSNDSHGRTIQSSTAVIQLNGQGVKGTLTDCTAQMHKITGYYNSDRKDSALCVEMGANITVAGGTYESGWITYEVQSIPAKFGNGVGIHVTGGNLTLKNNVKVSAGNYAILAETYRKYSPTINFDLGSETVSAPVATLYGDYLSINEHLHLTKGTTYTIDSYNYPEGNDGFDISIISVESDSITVTAEGVNLTIHNKTSKTITINGVVTEPVTDGQGGDGAGTISVSASPLCSTYNGTVSGNTSSSTDESKPCYHVILRDTKGNIISEQWVTEGESISYPEGYVFDLDELNCVYRDVDATAVSGPDAGGYTLVNTSAE